MKSDLCREVYNNVSLVILEGPLLEVLCTSTLQYHACACAEGSHPDLEILGAWEYIVDSAVQNMNSIR